MSFGRFSEMTEEERKLFGCPTCGFRISANVDSCSRCGAKFGKDAKVECPFCGETVDRGCTVCPACRIPFGDFVAKVEERVTDESIDSLLTEIIEIEAKKVKEEAKKLSCPKCSWMVDESEEKCPRCGNVFAENVTYMCPVCAALVHFEAERCGECGANFVEDEMEEAEAPEQTGPALVIEEEPSRPVVVKEVQEPLPEEATSASAEEVVPEATEVEEPGEEKAVAAEEPAPAEAEEKPEPEPEIVPEPVEPEPARTEEPPAGQPPEVEEPKEQELAPEAEPEKTEEVEEPAKPKPPVRRLKTRKLKAKPKKG